MAKTLINSGSAHSTDGDTITTAEFDCRGANFIVVSIADYDAATHATLADFLSGSGSGNAWSSSITPKDDGSLSYIQTVFINNPNVGQFQKFRAISSGGFPSIFFQAWDLGSGKIAAIDQQNQDSQTSATGVNTGSITPSLSDDLIIAACAAYFAAGTITVDFPFSRSDYQVNTGTNVGGAMAYLDGGAGPFNPAFNWTGTSPAAAHIVAFKVVLPSGAGSASATSTALAVGRSNAAAIGAASENSTASAVGRSNAAAIGAAASTSTVSGVAPVPAFGTASSTSTALAVGKSLVNGVGLSQSFSQAIAIGLQNFAGPGSPVTQLIPLIEWEARDGTTYLWAMDGASTPTKFYEKRVESIGAIHREVPRLCGLFSIGSVTIVLMNSDHVLSRLRATMSWHGTRMRVLYGDPAEGISTFVSSYTGFVDDWRFELDRCTITLIDNSLDRLNIPVTQSIRRVTPGGYPLATPETSQPYLIPWAMGRIQPPDSGDNGGQLPAYCINADTFVYVACHEELITITHVYVYGVLKTVTTDYVISTMVASGGEVYLILTFTAKAQDLINHSIDEIEVTWCGYTAEENLITQLQYLLMSRAGFDISEFDSTWDLAAAAFTARGFRGGALVVTKPDLSFADVVARACKTGGLRIYCTREGLWAINFIGLSKDPILALTEKTIVSGTFVQRNYSADGLASRLHFSYDYNYSRPGAEFFRHSPDLISSAEAANLGGEISKDVSQWFARTVDGSPSTPRSLAALTLALMRENGSLIDVEIDIGNFRTVELGEVVTITHSEGVGQFGFVDKRVVILFIQLVPSPETSQLVISGYTEPDLPGLSPSLSAVFSIGGAIVVEEVQAA